MAAGIFILKTGDKTMLIMMLTGFMLAIALAAGGFYGFKTHKNKPGGLFI
jgi:LPXTG-motif cell wall-anchored protein